MRVGAQLVGLLVTVGLIQKLAPRGTVPGSPPQLQVDAERDGLHAAAAMDGGARPTVSIRCIHHLRANRIAFGVPQGCPEMFGVERARVVAPLPQKPGSGVTRVEI